MVLAAKIFEIDEKVDPESVAKKLKSFHEEEVYQTSDGETVKLVTEILDLKLEEDSISGIYSKDFVRRRYYRREEAEALVTEEAPFWIKLFKEKAFMTVLAPSQSRGLKKLITNHIANKLSEVLFYRPWAIIETKISPETLKELHESNPQATKLIWFDDVDIPSIEKLCLAGSGLADTKLYHDYLEHGKIWYVVFEVQKRGIVVGITRNCVITLFSRSTADDFIKYILEDLLKLIV